MKQKFAIYSDTINKNMYANIKNYLSKKYSYYDCVIFSDSFLDKTIDATIMSSFYLRFFIGSVIFTNIEDYVYYRDTIVSDNVFLITTPDLLRNNGLADYRKYGLTILNIEKEDIYEI